MSSRETPFAREQLARARAALPSPSRDDARVLRDAAALLAAGAAEARRGIDTAEEAEGLLDLSDPGVRERILRLRDRTGGDALLGAAPLDLETVLLATYARNPDVEAARATWRSTMRMFDQATYLENVLLRYRSFARSATAPVAARKMGESAFPYPGVVALKGEMIATEVRMAREDARMRLRDAMAASAMAYVDASARDEEATLRVELVALADRMLEATRARIGAGTATQGEFLEAQAERSMLENERVQALAAAAEAKARLNTLLARDPVTPIAVRKLADPSPETPALAPLLEMAGRYAPEPRMARAEAERTALAIRMAEAMLFAAPPPGTLARVGMPGGGGAEMGGESQEMPSGAARPPVAPSARMTGRMGSGAGPGGGVSEMPVPTSPPGEGPALTPPPAPDAVLGQDLAWVAELRHRKAALDRKVEEVSLAVERRVVEAHLALDGARRMHALAATSLIPLTTQAVEERLRRYQSGGSEVAEVFDALRRTVDARLSAISARRMYAESLAKGFMAAGARPTVAGLSRTPGGGR